MTLQTSHAKRDLHPAIWLGLPLCLLALRLLTPLLGETWWSRIMWGEARLSRMLEGNWAIPENLTVVLLLPAFVAGVLIFLRRRGLPKCVGWLMLLGGLAALYFALEECSYGQDYIGFETPQGIKELNDQGEFNLHRLEFTRYGVAVDLVEDLFNNVPRQILFAGTIVGGMILPLAVRRRLARPEAPRSRWYWLIPNYRLIPISAMAVLLRLPDRLDHYFTPPAKGSYLDLAIFRASGEFKELCFAGVILLYLLSVYLRMGKRSAAE